MADVTKLLSRVDEALAAGDLEGARAAAQQARAAAGRDPSVQVALARVQAAGGDGAGAEQALRGIHKEHPDHALAAGFLGAVLVARRAHDEARPLLEKAVAAGNVPPPIKLAWGRNLAHAGRLADAQPFLEQAVAESPGVASAHFYLGACHAEMGRMPAALECFAQCVRLDPQALDAWDILVRLQSGGDGSKALELLQEAEKHNPGAPSLQRLRVQLLAEKGRHADALAALEQIPENSRDTEDHCVMAWALMGAGRWPEARAAAKKAVAAGPEYWRAHYTLGTALESDEPLDRKAIEGAYKKAVALGDPRGEAATRLGFVLLEEVEGKKARTKDAIDVLEAARKRNQDAPGTLLHLALAYRQADKKSKVTELCNAILSQQDVHPAVREQAQRLLRT